MSGRARRRITPKEQEYLRHLLSRAQDALRIAEHILSLGHADGAVHDVYEACRRAVLALLSLHGKASSKHCLVVASFEDHWTRTGHLPEEMGAFFRAMFDRKQRADYGLYETFDPAEVEAWLADAKAFVHRVGAYIEELPLSRKSPSHRRVGQRGPRVIRQLDSFDGVGDMEKALLREVKGIVRQVAPDAELWLYGSSARGEREPDSDWDVLVLTGQELSRASQDSIRSAVYELELAQGAVFFVSLAFYSRAEWDSGLVSVSPYHRNVERDAVAL